MADTSAAIESEVVVEADNKTEAKSGEFIKQGLMAFAEGVGPGKSTNPIDQMGFMVEEVLRPAFSSSDAETLGGGVSILQIDIRERGQLEKFQKCGVFFTEMARKSSEEVVIDSILVGRTGKIEAYPQRNADNLIIRISEDGGGKPDRDNYLDITFFWDGQGAVANPKRGSAESLKKDLEALRERLEKNDSKLLLAQISFISRQKVFLAESQPSF